MCRTCPICIALFAAALCSYGRADEPQRIQGKTVAEWIEQLNSAKYAEREAASKALARRHEAMPELHQALKRLNPEGHRRAKRLIDDFENWRNERFPNYCNRSGRKQSGGDFLANDDR